MSIVVKHKVPECYVNDPLEWSRHLMTTARSAHLSVCHKQYWDGQSVMDFNILTYVNTIWVLKKE